MQPTLIAIKSDNKTAVYEVTGKAGKAIFETEVKEFNGKKYYCHLGINHLLPVHLQGKRPVMRF